MIQKDPVLQARGEFPAGCPVIPRYPLSSCSALGAHTGARDAGAVTAGAQPWLGTGCCSCCCFYSLAFLGSAGITYSVLAQMALPWCCSGCEGGGGKPVAVLHIVVNRKSALSSFWAQAEKMFQLWFMWVELLLFAAFEQRRLKACGLGTSLD